ncbi:hypothetical protein CLF_105830 [Clonorchis sinensis]|uniref:Uncharacterized protein n=1 Tax=Clonorchis sinensis TaxID=79923 RepID=G7YPG3_CLOSI|nr:hypothetical protein CLF_105830 [Clonorchis sinensis]
MCEEAAVKSSREDGRHQQLKRQNIRLVTERQPNVLHQDASYSSCYDIQDIAIHIRNALPIRLLKIRRQPTTGFSLPVRAHQIRVKMKVFGESCPIWVHLERLDENNGTVWNCYRSGINKLVIVIATKSLDRFG